MIIHKYSEYEEPEKPPFTLDDVVRAITDMMMRYHMEFDEALRYLLDRGLPLNQFLRDGGLDEILDEYIKKIREMKREISSKYDYKKLSDDERERYRRLTDKIKRRKENDPEFSSNLNEATRNKNSAMFYRLLYDARNRNEDDLAEMLDAAIRQTERLDETENFEVSGGEDFDGQTPLDYETSRSVATRFEALSDLERELEDAKARGNLMGVDDEKLKELLGEEAYDEFAQARDRIMDKLKEAFESTGQVEEQDGVFKLTPAAARKVGDTALREIYAALKADGTGGHATGKPGEGSIEKVSTRPFEYGDSLSHLDVPGSMLNALIRNGSSLPIELKIEDLEIHDTHGVAQSNIVTMIDMSGSMSRFGRFYNAKKMALALEALVRAHYPEDKLSYIGFATFAKKLALGQLISLGPEPITYMGGGVRLKVDFTTVEDPERDLGHVPRYFTNIQKGLELARRVLASSPGHNKEIILITDGAPTAYYEGQSLYLSYPPEERGYAATLREARACAEDGITVNAFLLGSDFDTGYFGEDEFIMKLMKISKGRLFHPQPDSLTQYVLMDFMNNKRKLLEF